MNPPNYLLRKYKDLFDFAKNTIKENGHFLNAQNANTLEEKVTLFHFVRAGYLLEATYTLTIHGFATEGMILLRSLLNLYINIKWLNTGDTKKRFERFADFEVIFKKLAMQTIVEQGDIWDQIKDEKLDIHDADFEKVKNKYHLRNRNDFFDWSGKSIFKMAADEGVNLEKEYKIIYGRLSSIEHTGPDSVRAYLDDSKKGATSFRTGPRDENIDLVLLAALEYYFYVKAIVHNVFDIEWDTIEKEQETFQNLQIKYWGDNT
ncbi:MAG: DUF5677 domain-containing protein [Candidatus Celaenobacter polaris]|nr:DUF5677 domain-containing protein [Candidatus Celaenobacter polaris]